METESYAPTVVQLPDVDTLTKEQLLLEMEALTLSLQEDLHRVDPVSWDEDKCGDVLWSGQKRIMRAVQKHRRVAAMTCHGIGKSFDAGRIAGWWIDTHKNGEAFVVTTAPTGSQVKVILWKEIGRVHTQGKLKGRVNQTEWILDNNGKEEIVGLGRKPSDYSPTAFQGIHAPYVLIIVDEANGVRGPLWDAIDSLMANDGSKILIIGNPDDPSGEFFEACKPGSGYHVVQIGAFESPNFTEEGSGIPEVIKRQLIGPSYVEERRKKWAPHWTWTDDHSKVVPPPESSLEDTHPFWQSKILGQFPVQSAAGSLIPLTWIRAAQERTLKPVGPTELGLDVGASENGDPSCLGWRRGPVFRIIYEERQPDTMKSCGKFLQHLQNPVYGAHIAKVDYIGVGRGVVDRSKEVIDADENLRKYKVYPISVGNKAINEAEFENLLSELWWNVRTLFETGQIDIAPNDEDEELAEQLLMLRWAPNSKGKTVVSYGNGPSPNRADSLLFTFAPIPLEIEDDWVTW